jgi:hypothetical protein
MMKSATTAMILPAMIGPFELEVLRGEAVGVEKGTADDIDKDCVDADVDNGSKESTVDDDCVEGDVTTRSGLRND